MHAAAGETVYSTKHRHSERFLRACAWQVRAAELLPSPAIKRGEQLNLVRRVREQVLNVH